MLSSMTVPSYSLSSWAGSTCVKPVRPQAVLHDPPLVVYAQRSQECCIPKKWKVIGVV